MVLLTRPSQVIVNYKQSASHMYQYFIKVVGSEHRKLDGSVKRTNEYSVTYYDKDSESDARQATLPGEFQFKTRTSCKL